jgi:hypothetical protein
MKLETMSETILNLNEEMKIRFNIKTEEFSLYSRLGLVGDEFGVLLQAKKYKKDQCKGIFLKFFVWYNLIRSNE